MIQVLMALCKDKRFANDPTSRKKEAGCKMFHAQSMAKDSTSWENMSGRVAIASHRGGRDADANAACISKSKSKSRERAHSAR